MSNLSLNPFSELIKSQTAYEEFHNLSMNELTEKARENNMVMAEIRSVINELEKQRRDNPNAPVDLTAMQDRLEYLKELCQDMRSIYTEMQNRNDSISEDANTIFPDDLTNVDPNAIERMIEELDVLKTYSQGDVQQLMAEMQKFGSLLIAITEMNRETAKKESEGIERICNNMGRAAGG